MRCRSTPEPSRLRSVSSLQPWPWHAPNFPDPVALHQALVDRFLPFLLQLASLNPHIPRLRGWRVSLVSCFLAMELSSHPAFGRPIIQTLPLGKMRGSTD